MRTSKNHIRLTHPITNVAHGVQVVFDCRDPARLADFYALVLHYKLQEPPEGYRTWEEWLNARGIPQEDWNSASAIVDPAGKDPRIYFQQMDTPKLGKNRLHIDVNASGGSRVSVQVRKEQVNTEVDRLLALGAAKQREVEETGEYCVVMLDPEGNEFCVQ
jgi:Glyoxalase-like domain